MDFSEGTIPISMSFPYSRTSSRTTTPTILNTSSVSSSQPYDRDSLQILVVSFSSLLHPPPESPLALSALPSWQHTLTASTAFLPCSSILNFRIYVPWKFFQRLLERAMYAASLSFSVTLLCLHLFNQYLESHCCFMSRDVCDEGSKCSFLGIYLSLFDPWVFYLYACLCIACAWCPRGSEEGIGFLGTGVIDCC